ncbi:MAG TPA: hypothetical protein VGF99_14785 [Myxococcota bacterium]
MVAVFMATSTLRERPRQRARARDAITIGLVTLPRTTTRALPTQPTTTPTTTAPEPATPQTSTTTPEPPKTKTTSSPTTTPTTPTTTPTTTAATTSGPRVNEAPGALVHRLRGSDDKGPQPSRATLEGALDFVPEADDDSGRSGAVLAAAKAERALRRDIAFHDVTVGMASDWFREVKGALTRRFQPIPADLDDPRTVSRETIVKNFVLDPTSWDDEAKKAMLPMLLATNLSSQDPVKRLALSNSANLAEASTSVLRRQTLDDLLARRDAGLSVRYAVEVDVHHDSAGRLTAVDIVRGSSAADLREKVRKAIEEVLATAPVAPVAMTKGRPFRSRWVVGSTWFIEPPACMFAPSDSFGMSGNETMVNCGGTFDFKAPSLQVQQAIVAELVRVETLKPRAPPP